ncbi:putative integrase [Cucumis melo var. makuwa]|uniref:Integrase n=1 Tax=Cucumis melo var. makuwa TaxID=1194695 RepID=A0A5A7TGM2_CUCMM|nr:putative integrase [Cucumis melo var. makuwa]TYK05618.1 putative integrase [Cucumis melo var. makuwa]
MYRTLKKTYWWPGMEQEIAEYVDRCLICQQVKPVRQRPGGLLNPLRCRRQPGKHFEERVKEEEEEFRGLRLKKIGKSSCNASHCRIWVQLSTSGGFLVFSDALSILEVHKSNQKLCLMNWLRISFSFLLDIESGKSGKWDLRGNRPSLQIGELDKTVIFPLSTFCVLRDNDAVVEIELKVPDQSLGQQGSLEETMSVGFTPSFGLRQQVVREGV